MMMQMLEAGGLDVLIDHVRATDEDNLKGYYELEAVKATGRDPSWLAGAGGKAVKVIYLLLKDLPARYEYRVIFMRRDLAEVVRSQQAMLARRGESGAGLGAEQMADVFARQLERVDQWLAEQANFQRLDVPYREVITDPRSHARRIEEFLGRPLDIVAMEAVVDPALYRQRFDAGSASPSI